MKTFEIENQPQTIVHQIPSNDQVRELSAAEIEIVAAGCPANTCPVEISGGWLTCKPC